MAIIGSRVVSVESLPTGVLVRQFGGPALVHKVTRRGDGVDVETSSDTRWFCVAWNRRETVLVYGPVPATWCDECGHDTAPDEFGRVHSYVVSGTVDGRSTWGARNCRHDEAHKIAARLLADGWSDARVSIEAF